MLETWCQIHKLSDGVLKSKTFLENLAKMIGEVQEIHVTVPDGLIEEFICVTVKLDVNKYLARVVDITNGDEQKKYQVKLEKLLNFLLCMWSYGPLA